jgi:hypothetical protein
LLSNFYGLKVDYNAGSVLEKVTQNGKVSDFSPGTIEGFAV